MSSVLEFVSPELRERGWVRRAELEDARESGGWSKGTRRVLVAGREPSLCGSRHADRPHWRGPGDRWICGACHPPAAPELALEWRDGRP